MEFRDYYKILGVEPDADQDEIRRVYRKLARKYHPDVSKESDAESRFKDISEAYEVLKDPEKRAAFDQVRSNPGGFGGPGGGWQPPPGFERGFGFGGGGFTQGDASQFSDFFETLFGGRGGGWNMSTRGADQRAVIRIDLDTAFKGGTRQIKVSETGPDGQPRQRSLNVRIPAGVGQGQQIRLRGQGGAGRGGAEAGDILLEVTISPHPVFSVEGRDLHMTLPIAPWEAALGERIELDTPSGRVGLRIPPGAESGKRMRLKGRGLPGKQPGDLYVTLRMATPPADSEAVEAAYRNLAEVTGFDPRETGGRS
jgi:curved DNA-binding protein